MDQVRVAEPTLDELLHSVAYTRLPAQFYQLLQLAIPAAAELWTLGWYRSAGWMALVSCFGLWALCAKRLDEAQSIKGPPAWLRTTRTVTKGVGLALGGVLAVDMLMRILSFGFRCPGCAG